MQICVCGWYYYHDLLDILDDIVNEGKHSVKIVAHRFDPILGSHVIPYHEKENIGVEYGAYDYFIKNFWDGKSKVLFMHDDVRIQPIMYEYKMLPKTTIFNNIEKCDVDLGYIFKGKFDELDNYGIHGRGILMSARFIQCLLDKNNGLWWDEGNNGHIWGPTPEHCKHFNEADYRLREFWRDLQEKGTDMTLGVPIYVPSFDADFRGGRSSQIINRIDRFKQAPMDLDG